MSIDFPYSVEPAKSNRASCKVCKQKIDKDALRIGTETMGAGDYTMTSWRHIECQKNPKRGLDSLDDLKGFASLTAEQQAAVKKWFESGPAASPKKRSAEELDDVQTLDPKKMKAGELKAACKKHDLDATGTDAELKERLEEVVERAAHEAKYKALSVAALKDLLRANGALLGGAKDELVNRCVDHKMFGCLPRCPQCGGGTLKVNYASLYGHGGMGNFYCPGTYDGESFHRCSFAAKAIARVPWVE